MSRKIPSDTSGRLVVLHKKSTGRPDFFSPANLMTPEYSEKDDIIFNSTLQPKIGHQFF